MFSLPLTQWISRAMLAEDFLDRGDRLRPIGTTERREMRGRYKSVWRAAQYDLAALPEGTVLVVTQAGGRGIERALLVRDGQPVELGLAEAEDLLDPAGARRLAWASRVRRSRVPRKPFRFVFAPGHGYEADTVYDWGGETSVAACVRAGPAYVTIRAVTYAEADELGLI